MKTTIDIADAILARVRSLAAREKRTLRQVVEEGLQLVLRSRREVGRFRLRKASFRGEGLSPEVREGSWESIRDQVYEGRGG